MRNMKLNRENKEVADPYRTFSANDSFNSAYLISLSPDIHRISRIEQFVWWTTEWETLPRRKRLMPDRLWDRIRMRSGELAVTSSEMVNDGAPMTAVPCAE